MGWFYQCIKWSARLALPIFFGKLEVRGREHIPTDLPFLLAPNHQNAFLDAILVGSYTPKEVSFMTRADVFVPPYDTILHALNMIPVYRIRDGYDQLKKNDETFAICDARLENDQPILIFPEGNMGEGYHLRKTSKGTARMALQSQEKLKKDLLIIPVAVNYNYHDHPRSGASLIFGDPINVRDVFKNNDERPAKQILQLKKQIEDAIKEIMLLPEKEDWHDNSKRILKRKYKHLSFQEKKDMLAEGIAIEDAVVYAALSPLRALLTIPNILPHLIINSVVNGMIDPQFTLSLKYLLGLVLFPLWWLLLLVILGVTIGIKWAIGITFACIIILFFRQGIQNLIRGPLQTIN